MTVLSPATRVSLARYYGGFDEARAGIDVDHADQSRAAAARQRDEPLAFLLDNRDLSGELVDEPRFTDVYARLLHSFHERGVHATRADLDRYASVARHPTFTGSDRT